MSRTGCGAQYQRPRHVGQEQYVVGWVCCWEPEYVLFSSFLESFITEIWFPLKYSLNQIFKFRFDFTNSLTQRHTDLSRWWLTVLPKVKHMLKIFLLNQVLEGFACSVGVYILMWWVELPGRTVAGYATVAMFSCSDAWGHTMNWVSCRQTCGHLCTVHSLALPASSCVYFIEMQIFVTPV